MGLKPDHWIRKMALEQGMIEPFVDHQVREGVISYGVSSYGYDIRVADEFKIFTNVYSAIVDPKHFDPQSMVDYKGEICIIPPNSFVLAKTVEYFRIPRKVLTICLGKSTYARCFTGDTRVALVDGSSPTLEEMARRAENGEMFFGYSVDRQGRIIVTLLDVPRYIGTEPVIEVGLDNGSEIRCTPDHRFVTRDGKMVQAHELRPGNSLMPLYRNTTRNEELVYQPVNGSIDRTHEIVDQWEHRINLNTSGERSLDPYERRAAIREAVANISQDHKFSGQLASDPYVFRQSYSDSITRKNELEQVINHKVTSIRSVPGDHDVYCLTVPEAGNFALEAGVFVSNCGLIVNVTPFEPEWEGYVTLEISNTTPLPARIYANEGIAQVLFFEADDVCETSYADKKGKYQRQQSIILPKI